MYFLNSFLNFQFNKQTKEASSYAEKTEEIQLQASDLIDIPFHCALTYLFNPFSILNCVGKTTTIWSNFLLSGSFYALSTNNMFFCLLLLALETQKNFYPFVLIVPVALVFSEESKSKIPARAITIFSFVLILLGLQYGSFLLMGSWSFLDSTYGFM